ncbi:hypothetical protein SEA_BUNKER_58 [Gordonia phage Bunker]|nr:hypothetical protein SEA_BUNKER_58 [Gordonia phage Bunker]
MTAPDAVDGLASGPRTDTVPTSSCRHCGQTIARLITPWGPKWFHLPTHTRSSQYERFCRLRIAEPDGALSQAPSVARWCGHCGRDWHGLAITRRIEEMRIEYRDRAEDAYLAGEEQEYGESAILGGYRYDDDDSPVLCPGSEFVGPLTAEMAARPRQLVMQFQFLIDQALSTNRNLIQRMIFGFGNGSYSYAAANRSPLGIHWVIPEPGIHWVIPDPFWLRLPPVAQLRTDLAGAGSELVGHCVEGFVFEVREPQADAAAGDRYRRWIASRECDPPDDWARPKTRPRATATDQPFWVGRMDGLR